jgi:hypothetical protein
MRIFDMKTPRFRHVLVLMVAFMPLYGCADFCRDIYDGIRNRNEALRHPAGDNRPAMPDYDAYQRERDKLKKHEPQEQ